MYNYIGGLWFLYKSRNIANDLSTGVQGIMEKTMNDTELVFILSKINQQFNCYF